MLVARRSLETVRRYEIPAASPDAEARVCNLQFEFTELAVVGFLRCHESQHVQAAEVVFDFGEYGRRATGRKIGPAASFVG